MSFRVETMTLKFLIGNIICGSYSLVGTSYDPYVPINEHAIAAPRIDLAYRRGDAAHTCGHRRSGAGSAGERTQAGLARAKQQGKTLGRPTKTSEAQRKEILAKHQAGTTITELAKQYGVSRLSIARIAKPQGTCV
jgi:hypothetical protein